LPVQSCRGFSTAGGGSCRCTAGVQPGLQGVQAANSSWLNSAQVKKQSLQRSRHTYDADRVSDSSAHMPCLTASLSCKTTPMEI
jgi:hypothetical protein